MTLVPTVHQAPEPPAVNRRDLLRRAAVGLAVPALAAVAVPAARAAAWPPPAPHDADPLAASLDAALTAGVAGGLPGVAVHIERAGEIVYAGAAGLASLENNTPLTTAHRFRLGSVAKTFTAVVVLQLVDEGVLSLDDTVSTWLDDLAVARIPNVDEATVRQLLNHTSGIYDYADDADSPFWEVYLGANPDWARVWTVPELLTYADGANHAPYFAPGESFHYSNTGYLLLGLIVETATGRPFAGELRDRILEPLALDDTFLAEGAAIPDGTTDCYHLLGGEVVNTTAINLSWTWTAGGMVSTTADVARFARAVFTGELVSAASFAEMFTYTPDPNPQLTCIGWGMGVWTTPSEAGKRREAGGGGPGFTASMVSFSDADLIAVTLTNSAGFEEALTATREAAIAAALAAA